MNYTFDHIHIRCQDLEAAVDFYVNMFGGKIVKRFDVMGMPVVKIAFGETALSLSPKKEGVEVKVDPKENHWGAYQICFTVSELEEAMKELEAKGGKFKNQPFQVGPGVRAVFMEGPDGVEIEILCVTPA